MVQHLLLVLRNARSDQEYEFNRWYDEHLREAIDELDGFAAAQRFELATLYSMTKGALTAYTRALALVGGRTACA